MSASPAYDMNPTLNEYQSLLITSTSNKADLHILLDACEDYMIRRKVAEGIIRDVANVVKDWRCLSTRLGIAKNEQERFTTVFEGRREYIK